jgi:SAM-dependent methyltransferase
MCQAGERKIIFTQTFDNSHGAAPFEGYDVVACRACGLCFADRIPSQRVLDSYYRKLSKYEYSTKGGEPGGVKSSSFDYLAGIAARFLRNRTARILELGCATGTLLAEIRKRGFANVRGLDPSPYCSRAAKRLYGIRVDIGSLFDPSWRGERSDFIVMTGVLEHVRDLRRCLTGVRSGLGCGGRVLIAVPDAEGFTSQVVAPFQEFSMEHITYFTRKSLRALLVRAGFRQIFSERVVLRETATALAPLVIAVFERGSTVRISKRSDETGGRALKAYVQASVRLDNGLQRIISSLVDSRKSFIVWGVGTHTLRLLLMSRLREVRIEAFIDSNPKYHGRRLMGVEIQPPEFLKTSVLPVVISSQMFQKEIESQIRDILGCSNPMIRLYDE